MPGKWCYFDLLNPFSTNISLLYSLQTSENFWFSDAFKGYRSGILVKNGLISLATSSFFLESVKFIITLDIVRFIITLYTRNRRIYGVNKIPSFYLFYIGCSTFYNKTMLLITTSLMILFTLINLICISFISFTYGFWIYGLNPKLNSLEILVDSPF